MKNIFIWDQYKLIEDNILKFLQKNAQNIPKSIANSPRSIWDTIEQMIRENLESIIWIDIKDYNWEFERRAMADLAFSDTDWNYYIVDVKTHNLGTKFNMPNLSSVERLARFYRNDNNFFIILKVDYTVDTEINISNIELLPIEHFDWECLTLWALWRWQLQIANANKVVINRKQARKSWMIYFCDMMVNSFYPNEISKISDRIEYFKVELDYWNNK